jgi:hypothetical protein
MPHHLVVVAVENRFPQPKLPDRVGSASEMILRSTSQLVLVLDPTDIFVVQPAGRREVNRGDNSMLCVAPRLLPLHLMGSGCTLQFGIWTMLDS